MDALSTPLVAAWWLLFWTAVGLSVGSFLNVVIYRLPRNRSLRSPVWSACPNCRARIRWYDNIPVVSYALLRGRCRDCGIPIAVRYVVIEIAMALIVLMLLDAFFIERVRAGLTSSPVEMTDRLWHDWPIFMAHIVLFACLLAMAAIDLEHYWVDVRFTNAVTIAGFVLHTLWTPRDSRDWVRPFDATAVVALLALTGLVIVWVVLMCRPDGDEDDAWEEWKESGDPSSGEPSPPAPRRLPPSLQSPPRLAAWVAGALLAIMLVALFLDEGGIVPRLQHSGRALLPIVLFFFLIVAASAVPRESDHAIAEAIYEERHDSRRMVLGELLLLVPAMVLAGVGYWIAHAPGDVTERIHNTLYAEWGASSWPLFRHWTPILGLATAATGYIVAGALGWAVRIVFTLAFGREAFGSGDIHMMAAAGCVAGWPVVLLGFFLTCGVALLGWIVTLPFKRPRALPLGPWLALSILTVVVYYQSILELPMIHRAVEVIRWMFINNSQPIPLEAVR
jgi:prepilin signal peptidase PulO-like enzyme (type II secretory pathway)